MPIFIGGMFKSGTSLLRRLIGSHPSIFAGLETNWFRLDPYFASKKLNSPIIEPIVNQWSQFNNLPTQLVTRLISESESSEDALNSLMSYLTSQSSCSCWCDKSPPNIHYFNRLTAHWPHCYLVHIIRDPRDVYASLVQAKKWDNPTAFFDRWKPIFQDYTEYSKLNRYIEIRYEDLVFNTYSTMQDLILKLNLSWHDSIAEYTPSMTEYELVKNITGHSSTTLQRLGDPMSSSRVNIWRSSLSDDQVLDLFSYAKSYGVIDQFEHSLWLSST